MRVRKNKDGIPNPMVSVIDKLYRLQKSNGQRQYLFTSLCEKYALIVLLIFDKIKIFKIIF